MSHTKKFFSISILCPPTAYQGRLLIELSSINIIRTLQQLSIIWRWLDELDLSHPASHTRVLHVVWICVLCVTGSAVAMIGANLRFGSGSTSNSTTGGGKPFQCHPGGATEAAVVFSLGSLGMAANVALMTLILAKRQLRRYDILDAACGNLIIFTIEPKIANIYSNPQTAYKGRLIIESSSTNIITTLQQLSIMPFIGIKEMCNLRNLNPDSI